MDHSFQPAVDPRKQELLEARFLGARVSFLSSTFIFYDFFLIRRSFLAFLKVNTI